MSIYQSGWKCPRCKHINDCYETYNSELTENWEEFEDECEQCGFKVHVDVEYDSPIFTLTGEDGEYIIADYTEFIDSEDDEE